MHGLVTGEDPRQRRGDLELKLENPLGFFESERLVQTNDALLVRRRGSDPNAENYSNQTGEQLPPKSPLEGSRAATSKAKRKRKRLTRRRMAELPNFDVEEILGEFEVDQDNNSIIL